MTDTDYAIIGRRVLQLFGIDLGSYKSQQMRRRLDAYLVRVKASSWAEYLRRLDAEADERRRFKDYLTINVTSFFRDGDKFEALRQVILPQIVDPSRVINIWSAGCSEGPEAYTLAMLVDTAASGQRFRIWATDIDPVALAKAKAGGPYTPDAIAGVPRGYLSRYFEMTAKGHVVKPPIQCTLTFQEHNLLRDPVRDRFDLIVCRNVIIYFTEEAKEQIFRRFAQALRPGGFLFIGTTETMSLSLARQLGLNPVRVSFYRRATEAKAAVAGGA